MGKEQVNHPDHYNQYSMEVIDMMLAIWGRDKVIDFCQMNAFKYRMRIGHKDGVSLDLKKEKWYLDKAKEMAISDELIIGEERIEVGYCDKCQFPVEPISGVIGPICSCD